MNHAEEKWRNVKRQWGRILEKVRRKKVAAVAAI